MNILAAIKREGRLEKQLRANAYSIKCVNERLQKHWVALRSASSLRREEARALPLAERRL